MKELINYLMTEVIVEQPLALPGSANHSIQSFANDPHPITPMYITCVQNWPNMVIYAIVFPHQAKSCKIILV